MVILPEHSQPNSDEETITRAIKAASGKPAKLSEFNTTHEKDGAPLPFALHLDGGGEWKTATVEVANWVCPSGIYEVYVHQGASSGSLKLNGVSLSSQTFDDQWMPCDLDFNWSSIVGEIGTPGSADTSLVNDRAISKGFMRSRGWILSTGEVLTSGVISWFVRYRRIG